MRSAEAGRSRAAPAGGDRPGSLRQRDQAGARQLKRLEDDFLSTAAKAASAASEVRPELRATARNRAQQRHRDRTHSREHDERARATLLRRVARCRARRPGGGGRVRRALREARERHPGGIADALTQPRRRQPTRKARPMLEAAPRRDAGPAAPARDHLGAASGTASATSSDALGIVRVLERPGRCCNFGASTETVKLEPAAAHAPRARGARPDVREARAGARDAHRPLPARLDRRVREAAQRRAAGAVRGAAARA